VLRSTRSEEPTPDIHLFYSMQGERVRSGPRRIVNVGGGGGGEGKIDDGEI